MCVTFFAYKAYPVYLLVLAFNRDEFLDRSTLPLAIWEDDPDILAGRDVAGKGTWLGISRNGRLACVTNFRKGLARQSEKSRGDVPVKFLQGTDSPLDFLKGLNTTGYSPFNVLVGEFGCGEPVLAYQSSERNQAPVELTPGIHGFSNGDMMDEWPKLKEGKRLMEEVLSGSPDEGEGLPWSRIFTEVLDNQQRYEEQLLPNTGVGLELEKSLCAINVEPFEHPASVKRLYGTRSQTVLAISADGSVQVRERNIPLGNRSGQQWKEERGNFTITCEAQDVLKLEL